MRFQCNQLMASTHSPVLNASCGPGGKITLYTGNIQKLNLSDDDIGIVIGHDIAGTEAAKGAQPPEFLSPHPANDNRIADLRAMLPAVAPLYAAAARS